MPTHLISLLVRYSPDIPPHSIAKRMLRSCPIAPSLGLTLSLHRRLYIFGGSDAAGLLSDIILFDVERLTWDHVATAGTTPTPRFLHTAGITGRYMLVAGGLVAVPSGGHRGVADVWVLDLADEAWEHVDAGGWVNNFIWMKPVG